MLKSSKQEKETFPYQMASYFDEKVTPVELTKWVIGSYDLAIKFKEFESLPFISHIGNVIIPDLLNCKNRQERVKLLKVDLVQLFDEQSERAEKALFDLHECFRLAYLEYSSEGEDLVANFIDVYHVLLHVQKKYEDYCCIQ